ncbi:phosphate ABC transporter permease subunit PstC [Marinicauda pacifica]|jgi:phosphate transport system permease protein|uniref:phosphate ABC transporter permease subunit PstC n=1 Tax=Marinicauda pacifica TaxID=1133559 RepID=UPI0035C876C8
MQISLFTVLILMVLTAVGFLVGRRRAYAVSSGHASRLHSLPSYYGYYIALWTGVPAFILLAIYGMFGNDAVNALAGAQMHRAGEAVHAEFERALSEDEDIARLEAELATLENRRIYAREAIERDSELVPNAGEYPAQSPAERQQALSSEINRLAAEHEARAEVLAGQVEAQTDDALARAGFVYSRLSDERRELMINDARAIAFGEGVASRDTPEINALASAMRPFHEVLRSSMALAALALAIGGLAYARSRISSSFRARNRVEGAISVLLLLASVIAIATTIGIVLSLLFESVRFFSAINWRIDEFLFGTQWSPQIAIREGQVGQTGAFGAVPLFAGTALITVIAMLVAVPVGLFAAIYLSEYASTGVRGWAKPVLEILAGIPTVVYGFFALLTVGPLLRDALLLLGYENAVTQSALAAGLVMGVMIIPFVSSLADDVINAVPQSLRDGAYAMGATKSETVRQVIFPAALPGIVGAVLLAVSRAVGETMIVVMAAGQGANLTANPLESVTTITVQIVMLLTGDQEFDSPKTLSAFALGLVLFVLTLILNVIALRVVQRYREKYD